MPNATDNMYLSFFSSCQNLFNIEIPNLVGYESDRFSHPHNLHLISLSVCFSNTTALAEFLFSSLCYRFSLFVKALTKTDHDNTGIYIHI